MQHDDSTQAGELREPDEPAKDYSAATPPVQKDVAGQDDAERDDDLPAWLAESPAPAQTRLGDHQIRLLGLFGLVTCFAVYFFLERTFHGQFGLHLVGGTALVVCLALPALWIIVWILRSIIDNGFSIAVMLLAVTFLVSAALLFIQLQRN